MNNPLAIHQGRRANELGREGLENLCVTYNAARAERGIRERYRIDKSGAIWRLETYVPDGEPRALLTERR